MASGAEDLGAVDDPVVAVADCGGCYRGGVRAASRIRNRPRNPLTLPFGESLKKAGILVGRAGRHHRCPSEAAVGGGKEQSGVAPTQLLGGHNRSEVAELRTR